MQSINCDEYTDVHRLFLQVMLNRNVLSIKNAEDLLLLCYKHVDELSQNLQHENLSLEHVIRNINKRILPVHMEIRQRICESSGKIHYVLINSIDSDITKSIKLYSLKEEQYFYKLLEAIIKSDNGNISSIMALNLVDNLSVKLMKYEAEEIIKQLIIKKWINEKNGCLSLSVRTLVEFNIYIQNHFSDFISVCGICSQLVVQGNKCSSCKAKFHVYCINKYVDEKLANCTKCGNSINPL